MRWRRKPAFKESPRYTVENPCYRQGLRYDVPMESGEFSPDDIWKFNQRHFIEQAIRELLDKRWADAQTGHKAQRFIPTGRDLRGVGPIYLGANLFGDQAVEDLYIKKLRDFPDRSYGGPLLWLILHEGDADEAELAKYMATEYPGYGPNDQFVAPNPH